jgi:hypothetical protein
MKVEKTEKLITATLEGDEVEMLWEYLRQNFIENETTEAMYKTLSKYFDEYNPIS